jgi:hypothetical protein
MWGGWARYGNAMAVLIEQRDEIKLTLTWRSYFFGSNIRFSLFALSPVLAKRSEISPFSIDGNGNGNAVL